MNFSEVLPNAYEILVVVLLQTSPEALYQHSSYGTSSMELNKSITDDRDIEPEPD